MSRLQELLDKHSLSQRAVAAGAGIALSAVSDIVTGKRQPKTGTVNRLLAYLRQHEPAVTYELVFGDDAPEAAA